MRTPTLMAPALRPSPTRFRSSIGTAAQALAFCVALVSPAWAQQPQPRLPASAEPLGECPPPRPAPAPASSLARVEALIQQAQQSALMGDRTSARELLAEAVRLDPAHADAAYFHGRLLEELGDAGGAEREYCRFLAIDSDGPDAADVRARLSQVQTAAPTAAPAVASVRTGIAHLEANDLLAAERAFSIATAHDPALAEAYLNRAIARDARGRSTAAIRDYRRYLDHARDADQREQIETRIDQLAAGVGSPGAAFLKGALVPGLGQMSSGRILPGVAVLAGVSGAALLATQSREATRNVSFTDPFGHEWSYPQTVTEYPYRTSGISLAVALTLAAAGEAYLHARSVQTLASGTGSRGLAIRPLLPDPTDPRAGAGLVFEFRTAR